MRAISAMLCLLAALVLMPAGAHAAAGDALTIPTSVVIQPAELAAMLKAPNAPRCCRSGSACCTSRPIFPMPNMPVRETRTTACPT